MKATALIDTGASATVVKRDLLQSLRLHPVGATPVNTPTDDNVDCPMYAVRLGLPNAAVEVTVIEAALSGQNIQALIGRDVLSYGVLIYQGPSNQFTLSF